MKSVAGVIGSGLDKGCDLYADHLIELIEHPKDTIVNDLAAGILLISFECVLEDMSGFPDFRGLVKSQSVIKLEMSLNQRQDFFFFKHN